jgi:hypothetical protein
MTEIVATGLTVADAKENLRGILHRIRKLLDYAAREEESNPQAAKNYRDRAEELQRKYRVAEEQLLATDATAAEPIRVEIDLCDYSSAEFAQQYANLFWDIARHAGVRTTMRWVTTAERQYVLRASTVGYEGDARYAEALFTSARIIFAEHLEPAVRPDLPEIENVYRLRRAGIDRQRIAELVFGQRGHQEGLKVGRLYKEACAQRGEEPVVSGRNMNAKTYREVYAREFVERLNRRLREARDAANSTGGALVLHGRKERVDEAFYTQFPELRPVPAEVAGNQPAPKSRKRKAWTSADEARYRRLHESNAALAGRDAGHEAADAVELHGAEPAKRLGEDPMRTTLREITGHEVES